MHIASTLLPAGFFLPSLAVTTALLFAAIRGANWSALARAPGRVHLVAGGCLACLLLWALNIRMVDGLVFHLLGMTTLTLTLGWCFALIAGSLAVAALYLVQGLEPIAMPMSLLLTVVLPASISWLFARGLYRPSLRHPFVYILGAGFLGGALVVLALATTVYGLMALQGLDEWTRSAREYWPLLPLLMFSEGFINGMCIAAMSIFYPDAVKTFDDDFYLGG